MAAYAKDLNTAETAYAAIDEVCYNTFQQFCLQKTNGWKSHSMATLGGGLVPPP